MVEELKAYELKLDKDDQITQKKPYSYECNQSYSSMTLDQDQE